MTAEQLPHDSVPDAAENVHTGHGVQVVAASFAKENPSSHNRGSLEPAVGQ